MMHIPDERTNSRRKVWLTVCLLLAVTFSLSAVWWRWENGVDTQNHAVRVMYAVVNDFLIQNDGRWPKSWTELENLPAGQNWYDPVDYPLMRQEVEIDFKADPAVLAQQTPDEFRAIRAKKPVFDFSKDPRLVVLLETIKKYHAPPAS